MMSFTPYIAAIIAAMTALYLPKGKDLLVVVFMIPWVALVIEFGVSLRASEFLVAILLLKYFVIGSLRPRNFVGVLPLLGFLTIALGTAIYTIQQGPEVPLFAGGSPFRNGYGRVATTLLAFTLSFSYLFLLFSCRRFINPFNVLKTYVYSCTILAVLGLIQLSIFIATGVDIFPIGFLVGEEFARSGFLSIQGQSFLRVSSFGGEPKGLGQSLVIALAIVLVFGKIFKWKQLSYLTVIGLLSIVTIATASTSAFITLICIVGFVIILSRRERPFSKQAIRNLTIGISLGAFSTYYAVAAFTDTLRSRTFKSAQNYWDAIQFKLTGRIQLDDTDSIIMESFVGDYYGLIFGRGLGLVHHYAHKFIPKHMLYYLEGAILPAKSGIAYYVGYTGIVGLIIMAIFVAILIPAKDKYLRHQTRSTRVMLSRLQALCLGLWAAHMFRLYTFDITWTILAVAWIIGYKIELDTKSRKLRS